MPRFLLFTSLLLLSFLPARSQSLLPDTTREYTLEAIIHSDTLQTLCMMKCQDSTVLGSIYKELGPSLTDFSYDLNTRKLKILHCTTPGATGLRRRYVKRALRVYTQQLLQAMQHGRDSISDEKHQFKLKITPIEQ